MIRISRGLTAAKKRTKFLKLSKGYRGLNSKSYILSKEQLKQSFNFAYSGRKLKKRLFCKIWIKRINTLCNFKKTNYSKFFNMLRKKNIYLNKKMLAYLAFYNKNIFNVVLTNFS